MPLRERVWLAQRIALARFHGIKWADVALLEGMSERTLRYHLARWKKELEQERAPTSALLAACQENWDTIDRETTTEIEEMERIAAKGTPGHWAK
ncbi:MAG: hypothetical protein WBP81_08445 [Solirubrobacteraceae bacterium]